MKATTKDLRLRTPELIAATERGEEVLITFHGKPRAKLSPLSKQDKERAEVSQNPAFGLWRDQVGQESVEEQVRTLRQNREFK